MPNSNKYDYYHINDKIGETSFFKMPKALFCDLDFMFLSALAKVLYMILLDRAALSARNNWLDEHGRVYIYYTVEDAASMLGVCKDKAIKLFAELDGKTGCGLIQHKRQGQGKPSVIYVKCIPQKDELSTFSSPMWMDYQQKISEVVDNGL